MNLQLIAPSVLRVTEDIDHERMLFLADEIRELGYWTAPICVEASSYAVMDGHHRLAAAKLLGLARIPVILLDYSQVTLLGWRDDYCVTPAEVLFRAYAGKPYPKKTTRHIFPVDLVQPCRILLAGLEEEVISRVTNVMEFDPQ